jgi:hypothetical protein
MRSPSLLRCSVVVALSLMAVPASKMATAAVTFTDVGAGLQGVYNSSVAWGDYDNDGDLDFLLTGVTGSTGGSPSISRLYRNSGGPSPTFSDVGAGLTGVQGSSVAWGDYDNDGDLDILLTGFTTAGLIAKLYQNSGGANPIFSDVGAALTGVQQSSVAWGDYDNDGDLDILLTGSDASFASVTKLYRNSGGANPTFSDVGAGLTGVQQSSVAWGDYDNDGDLDILLTGYDTGNIPTSKLYRSDGSVPNTLPNAPSGLAATIGPSSITFSWTTASDDHTPASGLSYNLRVGTSAGGDQTMPAMAALNGYRRVAQLGNAQTRTSWTLALPPGPYYWSVQAIDGAFQGSPFSASTVAVEETGEVPSTFELGPAVPNPFGTEVALSVSLPRKGRVELMVFDPLGRRLRILERGERPAGRHWVQWDGRDESGARRSDGIYLIRMIAAGRTWTRKVVLTH